MIIETKSRSILKSLSWRFTATLTTVILVYLFTGQIETAITVGGIEIFAKMAIYYMHERGWGKIQFGKREMNPSVVWVTGLPSSGKGELARALVEKMQKRGLKTEYVDGQSIRELIPEMNFTKIERVRHIQRVGVLAKKLESNGVFVVANFVSPDLEARLFVRKLAKNFIEVHVSTPLEECKKKDHRGLYARAAKGEISDMVGVHYQYEPTEKPEYQVDLSKTDCKSAEEQILKLVEASI